MERRIYFGYVPIGGGAWRAYSDTIMPLSEGTTTTLPDNWYKIYTVPQEHFSRALDRLHDFQVELDKKHLTPDDRLKQEFLPDISELIADKPIQQ